MRPVERGSSPQTFTDYADAKPFLVARLGDYCSYCERPIKTNLAVEHVLPKSLHPDLELIWSNFLLGCVNCNSTKGKKPVDRTKLLLPDQDNTFLACAYDEFGRVLVNANLSDELAEKANASLKLTGLDKFPSDFDDGEQFEAALERWQQRSQAWEVANGAVSTWETIQTDQVRDLIVQLAVATGFFSVWMAVFEDHSELRTAFVQAFPGTAPDCFDDDGNPTARPNGQL